MRPAVGKCFTEHGETSVGGGWVQARPDRLPVTARCQANLVAECGPRLRVGRCREARAVLDPDDVNLRALVQPEAAGLRGVLVAIDRRDGHALTRGLRADLSTDVTPVIQHRDVLVLEIFPAQRVLQHRRTLCGVGGRSRESSAATSTTPIAASASASKRCIRYSRKPPMHHLQNAPRPKAKPATSMLSCEMVSARPTGISRPWLCQVCHFGALWHIEAQ